MSKKVFKITFFYSIIYFSGKKMYVNLVTGNTCYEMPQLLETETLAETENMTTVLIGE